MTADNRTGVTLVASVADNKYALGRRYAEWCTGAPALEAAVAAAAMAQDEVGHARSLYPVLRDLAGPGPEHEPETRTAFEFLPFLRQPFADWIDFVVANFVIDTAVTVLLEAATDSALEPLAQRARRIVEEERLHWLHADGWMHRLLRAPNPVPAILRARTETVLPQAKEWLEIASPDLQSARILSLQSASLQQILRSRLSRVLSDL